MGQSCPAKLPNGARQSTLISKSIIPKIGDYISPYHPGPSRIHVLYIEMDTFSSRRLALDLHILRGVESHTVRAESVKRSSRFDTQHLSASRKTTLITLLRLSSACRINAELKFSTKKKIAETTSFRELHFYRYMVKSFTLVVAREIAKKTQFSCAHQKLYGTIAWLKIVM